MTSIASRRRRSITVPKRLRKDPGRVSVRLPNSQKANQTDIVSGSSLITIYYPRLAVLAQSAFCSTDFLGVAGIAKVFRPALRVAVARHKAALRWTVSRLMGN